MSTDRLRRELRLLRAIRTAGAACRTCRKQPMIETWVPWSEAGEPVPPTFANPEPCPECGRVPEITNVGWDQPAEEPEEGVMVVLYREKGHAATRALRMARNGQHGPSEGSGHVKMTSPCGVLFPMKRTAAGFSTIVHRIRFTHMSGANRPSPHYWGRSFHSSFGLPLL